MAETTTQALPSETLPRPATGWRALRRYPLFPLAILVLFLVIPAVFAPLVAPFDPYQGSLRARLIPPFWQEGGTIEHLLGTDKLGRDMLSRVIYGARVSMTVSLIAIFVGGIVGTLAMLAHCSGVGAVLDLDRLPRPAGVPWDRWLVSFPSFGFLFAVKEDRLDELASLFAARDLAFAGIGRFTAAPELVLTEKSARVVLDPGPRG